MIMGGYKYINIYIYIYIYLFIYNYITPYFQVPYVMVQTMMLS